MIARYVPARMSGFMMGAYFVATGVSQYLGSVVANFAQMPAGDHGSARCRCRFIRSSSPVSGWLAAAGALVAVLLLPLMRKLSREHQRSGDEARDGATQSATAGSVVTE